MLEIKLNSVFMLILRPVRLLLHCNMLSNKIIWCDTKHHQDTVKTQLVIMMQETCWYLVFAEHDDSASTLSMMLHYLSQCTY